MAAKTVLAIGTYTRPLPHVHGTAKGVSFLAHNIETGEWQPMHAESGGVEGGALAMGDGPSYLALLPTPSAGGGGGAHQQRFLIVACNEGAPDDLPATLTSRCVTLNAEALTCGDASAPQVCQLNSPGPCHLSIHACGLWACAATYFGGAAVSVAINSSQGGDRAIATTPSSLQQHTRFTEADPARQEKPHAHQAIFSPSGKSLVVCDLGGDCVIVYSFDATNGALRERQVLQLPLGTGPRHAVFHPTLPLLFVLGEMAATVSVWAIVDPPSGGPTTPTEEDTWLLHWAALQIVSTLPPDSGDDVPKGCSAIRVSPDGSLLFAANRGHDSVAIFRIDVQQPYGGDATAPPSLFPPVSLALTSFVSGFGTIPRDIALHPAAPILYVASQNSHRVTAFTYDVGAGRAEQLGTAISTPSPVCIVPLLL